MKLLTFLEEYGNATTIVEKLREIRCLRARLLCDRCGEWMRDRTTNKNDGIMFECAKRSCRRAKSVRVDSFFAKSRLSLCECVLFLHLWSKGYTEKLICDDFAYSKPTVVDWSRYCRELCVNHFEQDQTVIGGTGAVVEIDETVIVKRKYDRGRILRAGWLFGGIERRDDGEFRCFVRTVHDRSAPHLTFLIRQHVAPGTHIITDGWGAYSQLSTMGYSHSVVIHEENFVSPHDSTVHTQRIESTWCSLKRFIRSHGTNKSDFIHEYICEWIFRRKHGDVFGKLLDQIRFEYRFDD